MLHPSSHLARISFPPPTTKVNLTMELHATGIHSAICTSSDGVTHCLPGSVQRGCEGGGHQICDSGFGVADELELRGFHGSSDLPRKASNMFSHLDMKIRARSDVSQISVWASSHTP